MELSSFIRARLDDDEAAAKAAGLRAKSPWDKGDAAGSPLPSAVSMFDASDESFAVIRGSYVAGHVMRHDPARVLREVEAKRAIVAAYSEHADLDIADPEPEYAYGHAAGLGFAVRQAAAVYSDHPDYQPEWKA